MSYKISSEVLQRTNTSDDDDTLRDELLSGDESYENLKAYHRSAWRKSRITYLFTFFILAVMIFSLVGVSVLGSKSSTTETQGWVDCGLTAEEARARNCHYEPMQRSWIPDACYFPEPSQEYDPFRDRQWFLDGDLTQPAGLEVLARLESGDQKMAYAEYFHDEHCVYAWRKLHYAVEMRKPFIDSKTFDLHHTNHCAKRIASVLRHSENSTMEHYMDGITDSPLMFQTCIPLPWGN